MKRSKQLNLQMMNKAVKHPAAKLTPLALALTATLSACASKEEAQIVTSVQDCLQNTSFTEEQCQTAYNEALAEAERTGPKYESASACESEFGMNQCTQSSSTGFFMPFLAGYLMSSALDFNRNRYNPVYVYGGPGQNYGNVMTSNGQVIGRAGDRFVRVPQDTLTKPMPTVRRTVSRGGFGSQAAAKSNWGSRKSGWGG